ncbi:MAG: hypothetical protein J7L15_01410 [Clostridiales bacterium]|nr:hypothetical protein [Clostridiales bacterium]
MEMAASPYNIFGMLSNADFKFPTIKDSKGEDLTLSHGNFIPTKDLLISLLNCLLHNKKSSTIHKCV